MEVKIGVIDSPRELIVNSEQTPDEVETLVAAVLGGREPVLALVDDKGRKFLCRLLVWRTWRSVRPISARSDSRLPSDA